MPLAARSPRAGLRRDVAGGPLPPGLRENGLMAMLELLAPDFSLDLGIQDIVAGRLRFMIGT
jgi:hypothetical protein